MPQHPTAFDTPPENGKDTEVATPAVEAPYIDRDPAHAVRHFSAVHFKLAFEGRRFHCAIGVHALKRLHSPGGRGMNSARMLATFATYQPQIVAAAIRHIRHGETDVVLTAASFGQGFNLQEAI